MLVPSMYDLPTVTAESGFTDEQVFDLGISGELVFLVVVPELGACRVPDVALSHFMAGADSFAADKMPEHYSGALSGPWVVKRDRLRILPKSVEGWLQQCQPFIELLLSQDTAPAQTPATPAPVTPASDGPAPLSTGDIAHSFAGLRWKESEWKKPLGDKPKWLAECVVIPGQQGVSETRWNPVSIGAALVQRGHVNARSVRAKFQTVPLLIPWRDAWKTYEADNLDN